MSSPIVDDVATLTARAARQRFASSNDTLIPLYRRYGSSSEPSNSP